MIVYDSVDSITYVFSGAVPPPQSLGWPLMAECYL